MLSISRVREDKFSIGFNDEDTGAALLMDFGHNGDVETAANVLWRHKVRGMD